MVTHEVHSFRCYYPACIKTFSSKFNLRRHVNVSHLSIKAFLCEICGKSFASKQNVKEHRFIHTGEKPFRCTGCGRCFRQASQLSSHRKTHLRSEKVKAGHWDGGSLLALLTHAVSANATLDDGAVGRIACGTRIPEITPERRKPHLKLPIATSLIP